MSLTLRFFTAIGCVLDSGANAPTIMVCWFNTSSTSMGCNTVGQAERHDNAQSIIQVLGMAGTRHLAV